MQKNKHDPYLPEAVVPPSSPPTIYLLATRVRIPIVPVAAKTRTLKPNDPAGYQKP